MQIPSSVRLKGDSVLGRFVVHRDAGVGVVHSHPPDSMVKGRENVTRYPYLFAELLRRGYSDGDGLKIAGRNHLRAMRQMEKVAAELQKTQAPFIGEGLTPKWTMP